MTRPLQRIMLVEDDPDIQLVTRLSLETGGGYEVRVCASGAEALQSAAAYAPDLILLDVMMPGMDGLATIDALRKLPEMAATAMVFFTATVMLASSALMAPYLETLAGYPVDGITGSEQAALSNAWQGDTGMTYQVWQAQWNQAMESLVRSYQAMASTHESNTMSMLARDTAEAAKWGG